MTPLMPANYASKSLNKLGWAVLWGLLSILFITFIYAHEWVWVWAVIATFFCWKSLVMLKNLVVQGLFQAKLQREIKTPTDNHGSAKWCTEKQIKQAGLDDPNNGVAVGVLGNTTIFFAFTHGLASAPAGTGKTTGLILPAILHGYRVPQGNGKSYVAPMINIDVKCELTPMTKAMIEAHHGHKVVCLNPSLSNGLPNVSFNPLYVVIDDMKDIHLHRHALTDAIEIATILLPEPAGGTDKNVFFRNGSRDFIIVIVIFLAGEHPDKCTLPEVFSIIASPKRLMLYLKKAEKSDYLVGDLSTLASGLLETDEDHFADFVSGALQVLLPFAPSTDIGQSVARDEFRFENMYHHGQLTSVSILAPYDRRTAYASWTGLVVKMAVKALMRVGINKPVIFNLDEATNFNLEGLAQDLTAIRGYGGRVRLIFQAKSELIRAVGQHSTDTIYSQTDIKQFFGVTSYKEAKEISDFFGEYTVKQNNISPDKTTKDADQKASVGEMARALYRPEDITNMPKDEQIVIIQGLPPIKCKRLAYNHVASWHHMLDDNPLEGGKLPLKRKLDVSYHEVAS